MLRGTSKRRTSRESEAKIAHKSRSGEGLNHEVQTVNYAGHLQRPKFQCFSSNTSQHAVHGLCPLRQGPSMGQTGPVPGQTKIFLGTNWPFSVELHSKFAFVSHLSLGRVGFVPGRIVPRGASDKCSLLPLRTKNSLYSRRKCLGNYMRFLYGREI